MNFGTFRITNAAAEDVPQLAALFEAYRAFYRQTPAPAAARAFVLERVTQQSTRFFVAKEHGDNLLGFVHLMPSTSTLAMLPTWLLEDLYVAPEGRRRGVAEALMLHAEAFARETGAARLTLSTATDNTAAQALYRKVGYLRDEQFWYFHRLLR